MDLSIIIVSYNSMPLLDKCLESLQSDSGSGRVEIIVVDNGSSDGTVDVIRRKYPAVQIIENAQNQGFAAANNLGIKNSNGRYVLLLNPDTEVPAGTCEDMLRFMQKSDVMIAGCRLLYPDGSTQRSVRSFPSVLNLISESFLLYRLLPQSRIFGKNYLTSFDYATTSRVDWVMGAFLMVSRKVFDTVGLLDERFFMFGEEADFCYRARRAGCHTWYTPSASIVHHWGGSSQNAYRRILWTKGSQLLFFQKHFSGLKRYILYVLLLIGMIVRIPVHGGLGLLSAKKDYLQSAWGNALAVITLPFHLVRGTIYPRPSA